MKYSALTVTVINIKKGQKQEYEIIGNVGMTRQIVCRQGRDDIKGQIKALFYFFTKALSLILF